VWPLSVSDISLNLSAVVALIVTIVIGVHVLGLYLVKQITEMHGGKVSILDNKPQGTVFILKINKQQQTK
jgi:K+-sensing histidine kinase KdpD